MSEPIDDGVVAGGPDPALPVGGGGRSPHQSIAVPDTGEHPLLPPRITGSFFAVHDLGVLVVAFALLGVGLFFHARMNRVKVKTFDKDGLTVAVPASWLVAPGGGTVFRGEDSLSRLEVRVVPRPRAEVSVKDSLELTRAYGKLYERTSSDLVDLGGKSWLRTRYFYAAKAEGDVPRIVAAVEFAYPTDPAVNGDKLWVVSLHGTEERVRELESVIGGSLTVK